MAVDDDEGRDELDGDAITAGLVPVVDLFSGIGGLIIGGGRRCECGRVLLDDADVFVDQHGIARRYRIGRTKNGGDVVTQPGFPRSVVPGMHRFPLRALRAWELATSLAGTAADLAPDPIVLSPPPPPRPAGRPPKEKTRP